MILQVRSQLSAGRFKPLLRPAAPRLQRASRVIVSRRHVPLASCLMLRLLQAQSKGVSYGRLYESFTLTYLSPSPETISSHEKKRHYLECLEQYVTYLHNQFTLLGATPVNFKRVDKYEGLKSRSVRVSCILRASCASPFLVILGWQRALLLYFRRASLLFPAPPPNSFSLIHFLLPIRWLMIYVIDLAGTHGAQ